MPSAPAATIAYERACRAFQAPPKAARTSSVTTFRRLERVGSPRPSRGQVFYKLPRISFARPQAIFFLSIGTKASRLSSKPLISPISQSFQVVLQVGCQQLRGPCRAFRGGVTSGWLAILGVIEALGARGRVLAVIDFYSRAVGPSRWVQGRRAGIYRSRVGGQGRSSLCGEEFLCRTAPRNTRSSRTCSAYAATCARVYSVRLDRVFPRAFQRQQSRGFWSGIAPISAVLVAKKVFSFYILEYQ